MITIRSTNKAWQQQHVLQLGVNVFGGKPCSNKDFIHVPLPDLEENERVLFLLIQSSASSERTLIPCYTQISRASREEVFAPFAPVALKLGAEFECGPNLLCTLHSLGEGDDSQLLIVETQPVMNDGNAVLPEVGSTMILDSGTQLQEEEEHHSVDRHVEEEEEEEDGGSIHSDDLLDTTAAAGATMEIVPPPQTVGSRFILPVQQQQQQEHETKRLRQDEEEEEEKAIPDYASWKVDDLRQELKAKGLDTKGLKADLVARLKLQYYPVEEVPNSFTFGYEPPASAAAAAVKEEDMDTVEEEEQDVPVTPQRNAPAAGNSNDVKTLPLEMSTAGSPLQTPAVATPPAKLSVLAPVPFPMTLPLESSALAESTSSPVKSPESSPVEDEPPPAFHEMKLVELRKACEERQLDSKGKKDVLISRLLAHHTAEPNNNNNKLTRRTSSSHSNQSQQSAVRILFTSFIASPKQLKQISKLGGQVLAEDDLVTAPTHVVVNKGEIRRTLKLLLIMTQIGADSPRIVHSDWLIHSLEQGKWKQDTMEYFPYEGNTSLLHALQLRDESTSGLFSGLRFFFSNDTKPNFDQFAPIIRQAGGELELLQSLDQFSNDVDCKTCLVVGTDEMSFPSAIREAISQQKLTWMKPKWILMCITSYSLSAGSDVDLVINLGSFF